MPAGRPKVFSQDVADKICEIISTSNKSLRTICDIEGMPCVATVLNWQNTNEIFLAQYTRAKEEQADFLAEEIIEISDETSQDLQRIDEYGNRIENKEFINRSRLRVDARKWVASKLKPKKYGDKVDVTSGGEVMKQAMIIQGQKFADENNS